MSMLKVRYPSVFKMIFFKTETKMGTGLGDKKLELLQYMVKRSILSTNWQFDHVP